MPDPELPVSPPEPSAKEQAIDDILSDGRARLAYLEQDFRKLGTLAGKKPSETRVFCQLADLRIDFGLWEEEIRNA